MTTKETVEIIILILLAIVAIRRWINFFRSDKEERKKGLSFSRFDLFATVLLAIAFAIVTFFMK